jgi:hypothetical protein
VNEKSPRTLDVNKGDRVRLLQPMWDGTQYFKADEEIHWPFDEKPSVDQACLVTEKVTPLTAPPMTDGKPPAGYLDPRTNEPLPAPPSS